MSNDGEMSLMNEGRRYFGIFVTFLTFPLPTLLVKLQVLSYESFHHPFSCQCFCPNHQPKNMLIQCHHVLEVLNVIGSHVGDIYVQF